MEKLFARFDAHLEDAGYPAMGGQIVDATIVAAPRQRMTDAGKEIVKGGGIPPDWQANPRKPAQKDRDARWTLKRGRKKTSPDGTAMGAIATPVFGYKSHINAVRLRLHALACNPGAIYAGVTVLAVLRSPRRWSWVADVRPWRQYQLGDGRHPANVG